MSMMKKTAALTVSAVLLLQPITASAVTWSNIVNGLRNSGSNRYTEDGRMGITTPLRAERLRMAGILIRVTLTTTQSFG